MANLVSILIPAYNAERWIARTIESAVAQTWGSTEIIVVDDGSTDSTLAIARRYESASLRVMSQRNGGAGAARNLAMSQAQGDYIQWLDADDLLAPDKIHRQMDIVATGASSGMLMSSAFGEFYARVDKAVFTPTALWRDQTPVEFLINRFTSNIWMNTATWLVSRRLTELAGPWDERLTLDDDGEYFCRVVASAERVLFVKDSRVYYRRGNIGSISRGVSERACESLLLSLRLCIGHLLTLEDTARTRLAAGALLQNSVDSWSCFFPGDEDRLNRVSAMARELGWSIAPPSVSWKYAPFAALLGWRTTRRVKTAVSNLRLLARLKLDELSRCAPGK